MDGLLETSFCSSECGVRFVKFGLAEFEVGQGRVMSKDGIVFHKHGDWLAALHAMIFDHE